MIIFDEKKYAENLIKNGYKNKKYISFDNIILVKYWKSLCLNEKQIKDKLKEIMIEFQDLFDGNILSYKIDKAINIGLKYDLLTDVVVDITQNEFEKIKSLETIELQKMMFILLLIWKFKGKPKRFRINNTDLMNLSKIKLNNNTFWDYIYKITRSKMLSMIEYKNVSYYRINIGDDDSDIILYIDKFDNVVDYYLSLVEPDKYIDCECCGAPFSPSNSTHKYCKTCAKEILQEQKNKWKRENWNGRKTENPANS